MTTTIQTQPTNFLGLGLAPQLLDVLAQMKFDTPTPIQQKAIPIALQGQDVIGIAQTGTGKTLAFGLPMFQALSQTQGKGLVLVPTRELAEQIQASFEKINRKIGIVVLIGGASMRKQVNELKRHPRIMIATPGRLIDLLNQRCLTLKDVSMLVLDEADRMFDMGFAPQINTILKQINKNRQTLLFSATMPKPIVALVSSHMKLPVHVEIAKSGTVAERLTQEVFIVRKESKDKLLQKLLAQYQGSVLLFTRTKIGARKITFRLRDNKHRAVEIHGNRTLSQRREALEGFKSGRYRILVATDIAARGIDVHGIELVINYDLPDEVENYIHRIGRTGRAGHPGHAITLATPDQGRDLKEIEKLMQTAIPISEHPEMPLESFVKHVPQVMSFKPRGGRFSRARQRSRGRNFRRGR